MENVVAWQVLVGNFLLAWVAVTSVYALLQKKREKKTCFTTVACIWPFVCGTAFAAMVYGIIGVATIQGTTFSNVQEVLSGGFGYFITASVFCLAVCFSVHIYLRWERDLASGFSRRAHL